MIIEHALLPVIPGREAEFERAFAEARLLIEASPGCRGVSLARGIESPASYLLLVEWDSVEAHEIGFRTSAAYDRWGALLHHFYEPFPVVEHFAPPPAGARRAGARPETSVDGPQRQLTQRSTPALWGRLVARTFALPGVFESRSAVSPAGSRAVLLESHPRLILPESSLASGEFPVEPAHLHGVDDTSLHLCLPAMRAAEVCDAGWGERHQFADHGTQIMIYGPRDDAELDLVVGLIEESVDWATRANG